MIFIVGVSKISLKDHFESSFTDFTLNILPHFILKYKSITSKSNFWQKIFSFNYVSRLFDKNLHKSTCCVGACTTAPIFV